MFHMWCNRYYNRIDTINNGTNVQFFPFKCFNLFKNVPTLMNPDGYGRQINIPSDEY